MTNRLMKIIAIKCSMTINCSTRHTIKSLLCSDKNCNTCNWI